ncbi:anthranilate phosphoribosyltransferase [Carnobacterium iners]|uniref:Anthranilate phosphoribosyltransferase n=1 Tax=Carnobacterium iners TaxID=1073423 RepID=A0A1X7MQG2_9LACT|nr:anthranilate phosphoribosyltransferase [Carnobacterium iners]SEK95166.1 anthranilate phosphoribosyltransferase [Carnobacterium iners]SMH26588.1 anthranilate phosphoribosyltransferase [Carnobacterium iners]
MIKEAIVKLTNKENLSYQMAEEVMDEIMKGSVTDLQIGAYLVALSMKGETIVEITASAKGMRNHAVKLLHDLTVLEIVGTGGDKSNSFNISTTSAIVVAAAGVLVAKHGNRAASSKSGAADVLEALGVAISIPVEKSKKILEEIGLCFLFAQTYHSAMKHVAPVRKELAIRAIFNILGPLSNPAGASMQLMGVYDEMLVEPLAEVLLRLGVKKAMVVYGKDGLDEISMSASTKVCEIRDGWFKTYDINPEELGFTLRKKEDLVGGTPKENAAITLGILNGEKGPKRDTVVLNSAAALYLSKDDLTLQEAIHEIEYIIDSGKALKKLNDFIRLSNEVL